MLQFMATPDPITIDLSEKFEHLLNAAITEAVIELRAPTVSVFGEATVKYRLKEALPDYPLQESVRTMMVQVQFQATADSGSAAQKAPPPTRGPVATDKMIWDGFRVKSEDQKRVACLSQPHSASRCCIPIPIGTHSPVRRCGCGRFTRSFPELKPFSGSAFATSTKFPSVRTGSK